MSIGVPRIKDANTEIMTDTGVLTAASAYHQILDPDGARELDMPDGAATQGGACMITNTADTTEAITVKQSDSSTTVVIIDQNESALLVCTGAGSTTGWQVVGIAEA